MSKYPIPKRWIILYARACDPDDVKYSVETCTILEELGIAEGLYNDANPQRNKWDMTCQHFGYDYRESCAATIIDRIKKAEGRAAELEAENARLKAPVSDEEMASIWFHGRKDFFTQVMASRATAKEAK
jgi:hypothetical protein